MKTTFSRTFFTSAFILLLAVSLLGASFQFLVEDYLINHTISDLKQDAEVIAKLASAYTLDGGLTNRDFLLNLDVASQISDSDAVICNVQGEVLLCSNALFGCEHQGMFIEDREYLNKILTNGGDVATGIIANLYTEPRYIVSIPIVTPDGLSISGIIIVSTPTASTTHILQRISNIFLSTSLVVVLIAVLAVSFFARTQSRPLRDLSRAAYAFGHGDLNARVKISDSYSQEMEDLALSFNNMASLLQKSEYQRQEFVANVSHELKTPMTTISGYVDGMLDGTIPENRHRYYLQIVSDETKRLSRLVRSMLDISQLQKEQGIPEDKKMHFDLEEAMGQVLITFEKKIMDKRLEVDVDIPDLPTFTYACEDYITQVIYNLLDNAVKFTNEGGSIRITLSKDNGRITCSIRNTGAGIPAQVAVFLQKGWHKSQSS